MLEVDTNYNISLTRGDTGIFSISLKDANGDPYTPVEGDVLRFAMAKKYKELYSGENVLILKYIPIETCILELEPEDTSLLDYGSYVYDVQFTDTDGHVSTIISSKLKLTKEVE